jgi:hypothetical protein
MCVEGPTLKDKKKFGFLFFHETTNRDGHISSDRLLETAACATRI